MNYSKDYIVYLLENTSNNRTYLGITNNSIRRLREHNRELNGGAKYTTSFKSDGIWKYHIKIDNLTKCDALSIERRAKNKRKGAKGETPIKKRLNVLLPILESYPESNITYY